jgi:polyhydroxyalkanoate synthesis regulator phasin
MTPVEGQIEARLQALHDELVKKGEVRAASRVKQIIDRVLQMVQSV